MVNSRFSTITKKIPIVKSAASIVAQTFVKDKMASFAIPAKVLTDSTLQFVLNVLQASCADLDLKLLTIVEHHSKANGQVER